MAIAKLRTTHFNLPHTLKKQDAKVPHTKKASFLLALTHTHSTLRLQSQLIGAQRNYSQRLQFLLILRPCSRFQNNTLHHDPKIKKKKKGYRFLLSYAPRARFENIISAYPTHLFFSTFGSDWALSLLRKFQWKCWHPFLCQNFTLFSLKMVELVLKLLFM